ncbi:MAG: hypothetical protein J7K30_00780 [Deltaproteobacteria bacterium]|nr:hypothetical protein [Deltaproteobacteria bacterium]
MAGIKRRLKTMSDMRRYLAALINETRNGEIAPDLARQVGYLLNILKGVVLDSDFEKRIEKLETEIKKKEEV